MKLSDYINNNKTFIIGEIGNNHNGSKQTAKELIDIAADAGVDAVKFQTFRGRDIVAPTILSNEYKGWDPKGFIYWTDFLDSIALPFEDHEEVYKYAIEKGIIPLSTPTSVDTVDFLESIKNPIYKIASMDLTNLALLRKVAATGKPVVMSTGMGSEKEIKQAIDVFESNELIVLHCISDYPTKPEDANLMNMKFIQQEFNVAVGLSDHSITNDFSVAAVALGAKVIEKHFTYDRNTEEKAEHHFSLEPNELKGLVDSIRIVEKGIGEYGITRSDNEKHNVSKFRRSLLLNTNLKKGDVISLDHISILRPNTGAAPDEIDFFIGKSVNQNIQAWSGLTKDKVTA